MNSNSLPGHAIPPLPIETLPEPSRLLRLFISALLVTAAADWLFYGVPLGASVGLFSIFLAFLLLANRPHFRPEPFSIILLILLPGAALQSVVECSFSNILVLAALLTALMGHTYYGQLQLVWTRWLEAAIALLKGLGRWFWFLRAVNKTGGVFNRVQWGLNAASPAIALAALFTLLFSFGNVIFGHWIIEAWDLVIREIVFPPITRVVFWICASTLALAFLHPSLAPASRRAWIEVPKPPLAEETASLHSIRSILVLAVLNVLFLTINTIDAAYLWMNTALPKDVTFSEFVHQGVFNLILCVIISALVLTVIFDQSREITRRGPTKALGLLWILQNIFLISSVALRLKIYVDAYQLSTQRVYVIFFLLLVATGFLLLAWRIIRDRSFRWLVLGNSAAAFILFYTVQFLDVSGFVATYNVERWMETPNKPLDVQYLRTLGPPAWPALLMAAQDTRGLPASRDAMEALRASLLTETNTAANRSWKSWQGRTVALHRDVSRRLIATEKP